MVHRFPRSFAAVLLPGSAEKQVQAHSSLHTWRRIPSAISMKRLYFLYPLPPVRRLHCAGVAAHVRETRRIVFLNFFIIAAMRSSSSIMSWLSHCHLPHSWRGLQSPMSSADHAEVLHHEELARIVHILVILWGCGACENSRAPGLRGEVHRKAFLISSTHGGDCSRSGVTQWLARGTV